MLLTGTIVGTTMLALTPVLGAQEVTGAKIENRLEEAGQAAKDAANQAAGLFQSDPWMWGHVIVAAVVIASLLFADVIRPGSLERNGKRDVSPHSTILWGLCALIILGVQIVSAAFSRLAPAEWRGSPETMQPRTVDAAVAYGVTAIMALVLCKLVAKGAPKSGMGFTARSLPWGFAAFILAWPVVVSSQYLFLYIHRQMGKPLPESNIAHETLSLLLNNRGDPWAWGFAGLAVFMAPIVEEIVYRGFLQSAILKFTHRAWLSAIVAAGLFAGVHLIAGENAVMPWYGVASVGVLGLCMGLAFERTKEIGVPITMHMLYNLTNVLLALAMGK